MDGQGLRADDMLDGRVLHEEAEARAGLILSLRRRGIRSTPVLSAIERLPRRLFLASKYHRLAYQDAQLPIECGQMASAPGLVAHVVQSLEPAPDHNVLEIGTGSGYQTAVLAHLAKNVHSVERYRTLIELAAERFATLRIGNVRIEQLDGLDGLRPRAPFDRIVANAAVDAVPDAWFAQLTTGGYLIAPVGPAGSRQILMRFRKLETGIASEDLMPVRTVSMRPGIAQKL